METDPVTQDNLVSHSSLTKVFDVPGSVLYRAEAETPTGQTSVFEHVRAYTDSLTIPSDGHVEMVVKGKDRDVGTVTIPYPYHFLLDKGVLFAVKVVPMKMRSGDGQLTFGLNYDLFCLPWGLCVIAHVLNGQNVVFYASRAEWDRGTLKSEKRELQMFLSIPEDRNFDIDLYSLQADPAVRKWVVDAKKIMVRKGK